MKEVASKAVVDNSGYDLEGTFKERDGTRVGQGLGTRIGDEDNEGSEKLGREKGSAEAGIAERGVGCDGVTRAEAEEPR
jgi:hypothetical protein